MNSRMRAGNLMLALLLTFVTADFLPIEATPAKMRVYYIAAEKVAWDYAPRGRNLTGTPSAEIDPDEESPETRSLRTTYAKAIYREYSDATFQNLKPRAPEWQHLGILGPLIRGEVGDTIRVVFRNKTDHLCTMHPHGLAYTKDSEGAIYKDGTTGADKRDDLVPPGGTYTYTWTVPKRSGPAPGDPSSILWMYHSHVDEPSDMNTGLLGPIIVSARGSTKPDGTPKDVDREFVLAFAVFDETDSWFLEENAIDKSRYSFAPNSLNAVFRKSNSLYSINGLIEGNLPTMTMKKGERVRWYLFANGNEDDIHTPHWHGQTVIYNQMRTDIVHLEPMMMVVADMVPDSLGTWLLHCHVNDHIRGGMQALFSVIP